MRLYVERCEKEQKELCKKASNIPVLKGKVTTTGMTHSYTLHSLGFNRILRNE